MLLTVVDSKGAAAQTTANVTVVAPSITVVAAPNTVQIEAGQSTVVVLTDIGNVNFTAPAAGACTTTAPLVTCQFSPSAPTMGTAASQVSVTIVTVGPVGSTRMPG